MLPRCMNVLETKIKPAIGFLSAGVERLDKTDGTFASIAQIGTGFLSKHIPDQVTPIVQAALRSIHYIAITVLLPAPLSLAAIGIISVYKISLESSNNPENLLNGVAFGCLINAVKELLFLNISASLINAVAATILFAASPLTKTVADAFAPPQTEPSPATDTPPTETDTPPSEVD